MPRIVGITGTNGAGKGEVVKFLVKRYGFAHYSVSGFITEEIVRRDMPVNRDTMILVGNDLRREHGPSCIIDSLFERACKSRKPAVIESLRAVAEVRRARELGGFIIGVDAEPYTRWRRIRDRRSVKDAVSYEQFLAQERSEMNAGDETRQDLEGAMALADIIIVNDGTFDELQTNIALALQKARL